jgi:hypothetical protein
VHRTYQFKRKKRNKEKGLIKRNKEKKENNIYINTIIYINIYIKVFILSYKSGFVNRQAA